LNQRPGLGPYADRWLAEAGPPAPDAIRMRFLGVSTLLLDDGETPIMIDGFFSRPGVARVLFGRIEPDPALIHRSLARAGVTRLAAVITVHSHYDHAMDAPEVARLTGAQVVGTASTANIARGWKLPESQIRTVGDGERLSYGRWRITVIGSVHAPTAFTGGSIDAPLTPPARVTAYQEGGSLSLLVENGPRALLVQGSAGFIAGKLAPHRAEVVLLGVGALGKQPLPYHGSYWDEVVKAVGARRVIPIHWDDFTRPLDEPLVPGPRLMDDLDRTMGYLNARGERERVDVLLPPPWVWLDPFAGRAAAAPPPDSAASR
jgi:L-ascorbate metabolism protein UlaG (beta-lactamase superfamily)